MLDLHRIESLPIEIHHICFREKRTGIFKVLTPFFYEDGDMYDIFLEESPLNPALLRISDYGLTLMKLSYTFEVDTPQKQDVLESIIMQNHCSFEKGLVFLDVSPNQFTMGIYQFAQVISKINASFSILK